MTIREKLMLLEMADFGKNVSAVCRYMGVSRKTYYQIKKAYDEGGIEALAPNFRRLPNLKNRVPEFVEDAVLKLSQENPAFGKKKISRILKEQGKSISPNTVRAVWKRNEMLAVENRETDSQ